MRVCFHFGFNKVFNCESCQNTLEPQSVFMPQGNYCETPKPTWNDQLTEFQFKLPYFLPSLSCYSVFAFLMASDTSHIEDLGHPNSICNSLLHRGSLFLYIHSFFVIYLKATSINTGCSNAILEISGVLKARRYFYERAVCLVEILEATHSHVSMRVLLSVPALIYSRPT